ncbi:MAG: sugar transporter [Cyclobacteriaceae bacterium]|nr:MAG: sugar transporter [Cyclobacteriaceae bacterium]
MNGNNADYYNDDSVNVRSILDKVIDRWPWFLICLIISLLGAFLVNLLSQPIYRATTSVLITEPKDVNNAVSELLYGQEFFGTVSKNLENEAYVLRSFENVRSTLTKLDLNVTYYIEENLRKDELYQNSPINVTVDNSSVVYYPELIRCRIVSNNTFKLEVVKQGVVEHIRELVKPNELNELFGDRTFTFGTDLDFNGFKFKIDLEHDLEEGSTVLFKIQNYVSLTMEYLGNLKISPLSLESSVLEISIISTHKQKGCDFVNELVSRYINDELYRKNQTAESTITFIDNQILLMSDSLSSVENRLEIFKRSNTDLTISSDGSDYLAQSQEFESMRSKLTLNNRYLTELEVYINQNNLDEIVVPSSIGIQDEALNRSIQDLVNLQLQIQTVGPTSKNPLVRTYQQRIEVLKRGVLENIRSLKTSNRLAMNNIENQIGGMRTTLQNLPTAEREYIKIQRNYNLSEDLYLFLMQKRAEAGIAKASNTIDIRVINSARTPFQPMSPKPLFNYALALIVGLAFPFGFLVVSDLLNNKIRSKDELFAISQIPYLGMVARNRSKYGLISNGMVRTEVAETFRTIRSNLRYMVGSSEDEAKTFLLTSSVSAEGKSFCANNLAVVFSNFGKKVLLIDADMRKEKNYHQFGVEEGIGLSDYLAGLSIKDGIIKSTDTPNLYIVTSGGIPPNPSELLINGKFQQLLENVKSNFDYVIIDTPPIGILSDGLELMDLCDVSIFIARENYTLKKHLKDLNNVYAQRKMHNLALLYNAVNYNKAEYGGYGKYYNQYYKSSRTVKKPKVPIK